MGSQYNLVITSQFCCPYSDYSFTSFKCLDHCPWRGIPSARMFFQVTSKELCSKWATHSSGWPPLCPPGREWSRPWTPLPVPASLVQPWHDTTCVSLNPLKSRQQAGLRHTGLLLQECQGKFMERIRNGQGEAWPDTCERRWGWRPWRKIERNSHHRAVLGKMLPGWSRGLVIELHFRNDSPVWRSGPAPYPTAQSLTGREHPGETRVLAFTLCGPERGGQVS